MGYAKLEGTWTFNETLTGTLGTIYVNFTFTLSDGTTANGNRISFDGTTLNYGTSDNLYLAYSNSWSRENLRTITILEGQTNALLLSWLKNNALDAIMFSIASKLSTLRNIKSNIKTALAEKGSDVSNDFTTYADNIKNLASAKPIKNISLDVDGVLTWDVPEIFDLTEAEVIGYVVNVNGTTYETTETTLDVWKALITGENEISVVAIIKFKNAQSEIITTYVKLAKLVITILDTVLGQTLVDTTAAVYNNKAYIFGGYASMTYENTSYYYIFNSEDNSIVRKSGLGGISLTNAHNYRAHSFNIKDKIYILTNKVYCYDPVTEAITTMSATLSYPYSSAMTVIDNKVYIFFGHTAKNVTTKNIRCYDPDTDELTIIGSSDFEYKYQMEAVTIDGKAYIIGGIDNIIYCYDPNNETNTLTKMGATLNWKMRNASVIEYNNKAYIFGGLGIQGVRLNQIQCYDPSIDVCTLLSTVLPKNLYRSSEVIINDTAYLFGGYDTAITSSIIQVKFEE